MTMMTTMIHMLPIMNLPNIREFCQLVDEYEGRASRNGRWDRSWQKKDRLKCEVDVTIMPAWVEVAQRGAVNRLREYNETWDELFE